MFRGGQANPYDDIVAKTTDENLTSENWELILNLCDKVQDEGEQGARNVVAAILKRLAHRLPNVQLYTLVLAEALTKNCGIEVHREIASRAFTQGLEKLITDRNSHDKVKKQALSLVAQWTMEFEKDPTLGVMEELYESLKSKGFKFDAPQEAPPPDVDDDVRRREEEELQRVLEMSVHDKGGRGQWSEYSLAGSSSGAKASGSGPTQAASSTSSTAKPAQQQPIYGGYVPSASPAVSTEIPATPSTSASTTTPISSVTASSPSPSTKSTHDPVNIVTRVRALHTFEPSEAGELAFEKGDIIKVVDRGYKDWWRGQLKGRTGIFPVNYVEPLPEPTATEIAKEAEQEASVFNQAANVDKLLTMLRGMDPSKDNLADNEEIQELYRSCMALRPKIVKLIDKYNQKRADLVSMNESFIKARTIFDGMMEESLARHTGVYDARGYSQPAQGYPPGPDTRARPDYPGTPGYGWPAGYDQPGYSGYPLPQAAYPAGPDTQYSNTPQPYPDASNYRQSTYGQPQPYGAQSPPSAYPEPWQPQPQLAAQGQAVPLHPESTSQPAYHQQAQPYQAQAQVQSQPGVQAQPQLQAQGPTAQAAQPGVQPQPYVQPQLQSQTPAHVPLQPQPAQPDVHQAQPLQPLAQTQPLQPHVQSQPLDPHPQAQSIDPHAQAQPFDTNAQAPAHDQYAQPQPLQPQLQAQALQAQPATQPLHLQTQPLSSQASQPEQHPVNQAQPDAHAQVQQLSPQPQAQSYTQDPHQQPQAIQETQPTPAQAQTQSQYVPGPPFAYVPDGLYEDPNVQAWATYYAHGGTDPAGSAYFISVPGVKEAEVAATPVAAHGNPSRSGTQDTIVPGHAQGGASSPTQQHANPSAAYGSSPYPTSGDQQQQQAWQSQYYNMPNQFANMSVGGDASQAQSPHPTSV